MYGVEWNAYILFLRVLKQTTADFFLHLSGTTKTFWDMKEMNNMSSWDCSVELNASSKQNGEFSQNLVCFVNISALNKPRTLQETKVWVHTFLHLISRCNTYQSSQDCDSSSIY